MINLVTVLLLIGMTTLSGCSGFTVKEELPGGYVLLHDNESYGLSISYSLGNGNYIDLISNSVFELGYNETYIIAKQYPVEFSSMPDKTITNYFIVPLKDKVHNSPDENKIGPLSIEEFKLKRKALGIPDELVFTIILNK